MENQKKKATSTKPAAAKEETVLKAEKKEPVAEKETVSVVKEEAKKEPAAVVKEEVKKEPAAAVKEDEKKEEKPAAKEEAASKKAVPAKKSTVKKPAAKKKEVEKVEEVFVQFQEMEFTTKEIMEKAKKNFVAEGHRESSIKSVRLYIKPEERMAYYVINEKFAGGVSL